MTKNKNKNYSFEQKNCSKIEQKRTKKLFVITPEYFWRRFGFPDRVPFNQLKHWEHLQLANAAAEIMKLKNG